MDIETSQSDKAVSDDEMPEAEGIHGAGLHWTVALDKAQSQLEQAEAEKTRWTQMLGTTATGRLARRRSHGQPALDSALAFAIALSRSDAENQLREAEAAVAVAVIAVASAQEAAASAEAEATAKAEAEAAAKAEAEAEAAAKASAEAEATATAEAEAAAKAEAEVAAKAAAEAAASAEAQAAAEAEAEAAAKAEAKAEAEAAEAAAEAAAQVQCSICLAAFAGADRGRAANGWGYAPCCGTTFCYGCIIRWVSMTDRTVGQHTLNSDCPNCRSPMPTAARSRILSKAPQAT